MRYFGLYRLRVSMTGEVYGGVTRAPHEQSGSSSGATSEVSVLFQSAIALQKAGKFIEALASYDQAIALQPDNAYAFNNRGNVLQSLKRAEEALASYQAAIALKPDHAKAHNNCGNVLQGLGRSEEALASFQRAIALKANDAEIFRNLAITLVELKRFEEALAVYDEAIALRPDYAEALKNRGILKLLLGHYEEGWADYEWRWKAEDCMTVPPPIAAPPWQGEEIAGRSIAVYAEQGLGDIIQFARYLPLLAQRKAKVTFIVSQTLHRLLNTLEGELEIVASIKAARPFDFQCPVMSLPLHFGTRLSSIPSRVPYLHAEDTLIAKWKGRLLLPGLRVGIVWQGSPGARDARDRSVPLREFFPLANIAGVRLISLQKNHGLDQYENIPRNIAIESLGGDFDGGPDAFVDTAAAMAHLDLVITSDTSIAHLAGALGRPVWIALKYLADSRWLLDREDSPWYPSARLFRQERKGDWASVFSRMEREMRSLVARGNYGASAPYTR